MSWDKVYTLRATGQVPALPVDPTKVTGQLLSECAKDPSCKSAYFAAAQSLKGTSYEWCNNCQACSSCVKAALDTPGTGMFDYMECLDKNVIYAACGVEPPGAKSVLGKLSDILLGLFLGTDPSPSSLSGAAWRR